MPSAEQAISLALGVVVAAFVSLQVFLGPVGWLLPTALVAAVLALASRSGYFRGSSDEPRVNCPNCGAPQSPDRSVCRHCERDLPGGTADGETSN